MLLCVHTRYNLFAHSSCTSVFILLFIIHSILYCTFDLIAHFTPYFIFYYLFLFLFYSYLYYIYYLVLCFIVLFLFLLLCPLSGPVLIFISLLIIPCMIMYVTNNKETWGLVFIVDELRCTWARFCTDVILLKSLITEVQLLEVFMKALSSCIKLKESLPKESQFISQSVLLLVIRTNAKSWCMQLREEIVLIHPIMQ